MLRSRCPLKTTAIIVIEIFGAIVAITPQSVLQIKSYKESWQSLTVSVGAGVQLQVLHVFAVQLHVEFLQRVVPLPQS